MSKNASKLLVGGLLILFGLLWLANNFVPGFQFNWEYVWPLFLAVPGVGFWLAYFAAKDKKESIGFLIPGTILLGLAVTFYINIIGSNLLKIDGLWAFTAFMYPGSVAAAFVVTWAFSKENAFLVPAFILTAISGLIFCATSSVAILGGQATAGVSKLIWPLVFICIGIFILLNPLWVSLFKRNGKWMGKTEAEWKDWGEDFGKKMEKVGEDIESKIDNAFNGSATAKPTANNSEPTSQPAAKVEEAEIVEEKKE